MSQPVALDGHLLKVLRALDGTTLDRPANEDDINRRVVATGGEKGGSHSPGLRQLEYRGLATRCSADRGYWYITDKGREALP